MPPTSRKLATPRSGVQRLRRVNSKPVTSELSQLVAAWQTEEPGAPKRCVVRCDGILVKQTDESGSAAFPCACLSVRYTIGGLTKEVLVDALSQSALTVWAESIDVEPVWDDRRISRLAAQSVTPASEQLLGAAINSNAGAGDVGAADARWLDVLNVDVTGEDDSEWSIHPIPEGARGVRFLNALASGANLSTADTATIIAFSADSFPSYPTGLVELAIDGITDQSIIIVPACARFLFVKFPAGTIAGFDVPSWIEWILAPSTLPGF